MSDRSRRIKERHHEALTITASRSRALQDLHTQRRNLMLKIARRLDSPQCFPDPRDESWLWGDLPSLDQWKAEAPAELSGAKKTAWAKERRVEAIGEKLAPIDVRLRPGVRLGAEFVKGELRLLADGMVLLDGIYLSECGGRVHSSAMAARLPHAYRDRGLDGEEGGVAVAGVEGDGE